MSFNLTKKPSVFKYLLLTTAAALGILANAACAAAATGSTLTLGAQRTIGAGVIQKLEFAVSTTLTITDATTAGAHGSKKICDFSVGGVVVLAASVNLAVSESGGIGNSASINMGVGSAAAATDDATLTSTEQNVIPSTAVALTSSAGTFAAMSSAAAWLDGHSSAAAAYLNVAVADADSASNDTLTVAGTITLWVLHIGDFA